MTKRKPESARPRGRRPIGSDRAGAHLPVFARVDDRTLAGIEAYRASMQSATPGLQVSTSDAVRMLLMAALANRTVGVA
jgi:hypothetical protein